MKRFLWLGFVLSCYLICSGCGDTFRPIIVPNPPKFPDPRAAHTVVSINDNGTVVNGTAMVVDVSGDSDVSVANVGLAPVHAVQQTATQVLVANHSVTGAVADSISRVVFNGTVISGVTTISLPPDSAPNFVAVAPTATTAYVTLNGLDALGIVNTNGSTLVGQNAVGSNPVAVVVTPNNLKVYVANQGSNSVSAFDVLTGALSARPISGSFTAPVWLTARSDSQRLYVLNGGVISTVDTTSSAGPDTVIDASISVPGATSMAYDERLNRLYVPGGTQLTMLDVSQSTPQLLGAGPITISTVPTSSRLPSDPCFGTTAQTVTVDAVASLPDGSRAYAGAYYENTVGGVEYFCPQVTVIDLASNTVKSTIAIPGSVDATDPTNPPYYAAVCVNSRFRMIMAAGGDSSRAYLATCDGGNVNLIDTSIDAYIENLPAPIGTRAPIPPDPLNPSQNPVFLFAGP